MENKMTPKQALEELEEKAKLLICNDGYVCDLVKSIYQALTELEETKVLCESFKKDINRLNEQCTNLHLKDKKQTEILEVLKEHFVNRDNDTSGLYFEKHIGYYEPYYQIKLKDGIKLTFTEIEFNLIKEWLNNGKC